MTFSQGLKSITIDPDERFDTRCRSTVFQYAYIAMLAAVTPNGSMQRVINDRVFHRHWRTDAERLRATLKKLGRKDYEFYPPKLLKRAGIKVKAGRKRRSLDLVAA